MNRQTLIFSTVLLLCAASCAKAQKGNGAGGGSDIVQVELIPSDDPNILPLPMIPDDMKMPEDRLAFLLDHFWDGLDMADTARTHSADFMEQNFVNYIYLFPHTTEENIRRSLALLLNRVAVDNDAMQTLYEVADKYLREPNSPMRNEDFYILFLESLIGTPGLAEDFLIRPNLQLKAARLNRPGTVATDFMYLTREGKRQTLHSTPVGKQLLLVFYDPECEHCQSILGSMKGSETLNALIGKGELDLLAIYTDGNRPLWDSTKGELPETWEVGFDLSKVVENKFYSLPAMPVLYLLDKDKTVILKDPAPKTVEHFLVSRQGQ